MHYAAGPSAFGAPQGAVTSTVSLERDRVYVGQMPAFKPAPSREDDTISKPNMSEMPPREDPSSCFLTFIGTFLLMLVVVTPVLDATRLLNSSTYVFFIGRVDCFWIIVFCSSVTLFFFMGMLLTERCGRRSKTDQTFMYLFTATFTTLGLGLLIFSIPMVDKSKAAYTDLMTNCNGAASTEQLNSYYQVLLKLRMQPDCINELSVEDCSGFREVPPYTGYLKEMELGYSCSGFCYQASSSSLLANATNMSTMPSTAVLLQHEAVTDEITSDFVGLLQFGVLEPPVSPLRLLPDLISRDDSSEVSGVVQKTEVAFPLPASRRSNVSLDLHQSNKHIQGLFLLAASRNTTNVTKATAPPDFIPPGLGDTIHNMAQTGWMSAYPPTLFTNANYKTTCDGEAARELRFSSREVGFIMYMQGAGILLVSVVVGLARVCSMSGRQEEEVEYVEDYVTESNSKQLQRTYSKKLVL